MEHVMTDPASQPLDETDQAILDQMRALHVLLDPPPPDLDERVRFAIALENIDVEVARLVEDMLVGSGSRGAERTRMITFDGESRTIIVTMVDTADGRVRIDGRLAPAAQLRVELRSAGTAPNAPSTSEIVVSDDAGRFAFDAVDHGLVQLVVHPIDDSDATSVVTPSLVL
jgi:hypothetical protein